MPATLVQHEHRRVLRLAPHVGRDGPHRDAAGTDEHQGLRMGKPELRPIAHRPLQGLRARDEAAAGDEGTPAERPRQPGGQQRPRAGERGQDDAAGLGQGSAFPHRYPCSNAGS